MKKGIFASYIAGITDIIHGESFSTILYYLMPEFITSLLIYSLPSLIDANFIGHLKSTPMYAALGVTNNLFHFIFKIAEAFAVSTVILTGKFNGSQEHAKVGRTLRDAFWTNCILGAFVAVALYLGAYWIYWWYGVADDIIGFGIPYLSLRSVSVFLTFVYFAFVGFLRGIKNTRVPMLIYVIGSIIFVVCDYLFIFGAYGLPAMGLQGSALASVLQYGSMLILVACYVLSNRDYRHYSINLFTIFQEKSQVKQLLSLSWPVVLDKAIFAASYMWLCKVVCPMGTCAVATFCVIKDMERFAFLPAIAGAQVITFLVSNDFGLQNWDAIKSNIKKVTFVCSLMVFFILLIFSLWPEYIIQFFDKKGEFTTLAARIFPMLSILVFFDVLQLILSGALRGAGNVKTVMMVRLVICFGYFVPLSYILSRLPIEDQILKFVLVYGSFYIGNALMSIIYINRFRSDDWKMESI